MPFANTEAMQKHLDEIARTVVTGAHAIVLLDQAGWHIAGELSVPANMRLMFLPPYSPAMRRLLGLMKRF